MNYFSISRFLLKQLVRIILTSFVFFTSLFAFAFQVPSLSGPVVDEAGLLNASQKAQIEQSLFSFKQTNQAQIQVLIIKSLEGDAIESIAIQVFDQWKLGDEKRDDGVLLLIAPNEKRLRIEVGQGLEGTIPDVIAKRIVADVIRPYFQRGEFFEGTQMGVTAIQHAITSDPEATVTPNNQGEVQKSGKKKPFSNLIYLVLFGIWLVIFIISPSTGLNILFFALSRGGGRSSGGGSGGWSGGGGRSSGGGASGGW